MSNQLSQVKHCISSFPFCFSDHLVTEMTIYNDPFLDINYSIYRVEFLTEENFPHWVDLICDIDTNNYLTFGGSGNFSTFSYDVTKRICESQSRVSYLEKAS